MTKEGFRKRIKHELGHLYASVLAEKRDSTEIKAAPVWMQEGISMILADQKPDNWGEITLELLDDLSATMDSRKFPVGFKMVNIILKEYGKKELLRLMKSNNREWVRSQLKEKFEWPIK